MKRVGILTSGGDAPGMNACIRSAARIALFEGVEVYGIQRGYTGLIRGDIRKLEKEGIDNIIHLGGTILGTSRSDEFYMKEGRARAIENLSKYDIDSLILIGGEGTFQGGTVLSEECRVDIIGVPGTIDNDVYGTDYTIGFDTAMNTALQSIDRIRDTALSHERLFFVEVMGRDTGFLALESGIAGGVQELLIPEIPMTMEELCHHLESIFRRGKRSIIVVVAEGEQPGNAFKIAADVKEKAGFESRVAILGHIQRGGSPTARDRILATRLGAAAVFNLLDGQKNCMVGELRGDIVCCPMRETWEKKKELSDEYKILVKLLSE